MHRKNGQSNANKFKIRNIEFKYVWKMTQDSCSHVVLCILLVNEQTLCMRLKSNRIQIYVKNDLLFLCALIRIF